MDRPIRQAGPGADAQRLGAVAVPTRRAGLGGWCPAADLDDLTAVLGGLGLQQPDKHGPPSVVDALGQPRPGQPRHGEILDGDRLVLADQPQGELVMMVGALVADPTVGDRDPQTRLRPVLRPLPLAAELPLRNGQAPLSDAQVPRVGEGLDGAVAGSDCGERDQAKIDPGGARHGWQRGRVAFDHKGGVVAAVRLPDDRHAGWRRGQFAGPAHTHLADLGYIQPGPAEREAVTGKPDRLAAVLGPEPWAPDPAAFALALQGVEPVAVGASRVLACLDQGDRGDLGQPCPLRGPLGLGNHPALDLGSADPLPGLIGAPPFGEGVVVDHPGASKRSAERPALPGSRVDAIAIPDEHAAEYVWSMRQDDDYRRSRHVVSALNVH